MSDYSAVAPPQSFSNSSAFAAAVQRAKQIAAKINPAGSQNIPEPKKRPLEDVPEPEAKKIAPLVSDSLMGIRSVDGPGSRSVSHSPSNSMGPMGGGAGGGTICNEDIRVPDKMVGLIIGRGGEQITRLQSDTGCKIQMAPESGGLPDRVCTLTGSREAVNRAKDQILLIVNQRNRSDLSDMGGSMGGGMGGGPPGPMGMGGMQPSSGGGGGGGGNNPSFVEIMIPGPKVGLIIGKGGETIKQLQEKSGAKMVVIQDGPSQEQEKPLRITGDPPKVDYAKQLVYELIAEKEMQMFYRGGRGGGPGGPDRGSGGGGGFQGGGDNSFNHGPGGNGNSVEVLVPRAAVGVVIGKGGDMIKKIQVETGARVQFQQGREEGPGDRKCQLSGKHPAVEQARQRIQDLIDSVTRRDDGRGNMGRGPGGPRGNGFGGRPNEYGGGGGGGGWDRRNQGGSMQDKIETTYAVPESKCGIIIGKGGETIKQINQQTGAHCELDRRNPGNENEKSFIIRGTPEQVENAKRIIGEKLGMGPGGGPGSGSYPGQGPIGYNPNWSAGASAYQGWPNQGQGSDSGSQGQAQMQMNPQSGQPDYSTQWVEYYRSLGMHREAEMIEQQTKQGKSDSVQAGNPNPPAAASTGPGLQQAQPAQAQQQQAASQNGNQADYSAQWAEYYRSMGKVKEAEAIENQMKAGKVAPAQTPSIPNQQIGQQSATPNAFPQAYGSYPGMNANASTGGFYPSGAGSTTQSQPGQQNAPFQPGYQSYPYSQPSSDN